MRQALSEGGVNSARTVTSPAPIGGWNASDSIADMDKTQAVYLDNMFPRTSDVQLRKGYVKQGFAPVGAEVRSLMGYKSTTGVAKLFAGAQTGIFDVTAGDAAAPVTTSTNGAWQSANVTTAGGSFLLACNGTDKVKLYDGATWKDIDGVSTPAITGLNTPDITNISKFKTRVILCKKDSLSFWYLPNNAIAGAAVEFPLGALFQKGGYLVATSTWTMDGGNGPDDYFVAITSEGEVALYKGTDPSSSANFAIVGIFQLAKPMGKNCFVKLDNDTAVITQAGIYQLSAALQQSDTKKSAALSKPIQRAYSDFAQEHADLYGWQITIFPEASMLVVNVPILNYPTRNIVYSYQFVMNTMTGAWCRFTGQHSEAWLAFDGKLYFALHNFVYRAWEGGNDNGAAITGVCKTAFSAFGTQRNKQVKMVRPVFQVDSNITLQLGIDVNFADNTLQTSKASYTQAVSRWDEAKWGEATWNGTSSTIAQWRGVNSRHGRTAALRLRISGKDVTMTWIATDFLVEDGDIF
jgi:hypothetical protein